MQLAAQCNQELLPQRAVNALLDAMEQTPQLTTLAVGKVIDPALRRRLDAVTMANRDLHRQHRVANQQHDTRKASVKAFDWAVEARNISESRPFEYCKPDDATSEAAKQLSYVATGSALWNAAKEEERIAVLAAFCSNTKVTSLVLANALLTDAVVADQFEALLASNSTLTSLNLESNRVASAGVHALAAGLLRNTTLSELKLANQHLAISQAAEMALAHAVDGHPKLLKLTVDLRNLRARELIQKGLARNLEAVRRARTGARAAGMTDAVTGATDAIAAAGAPSASAPPAAPAVSAPAAAPAATAPAPAPAPAPAASAAAAAPERAHRPSSDGARRRRRLWSTKSKEAGRAPAEDDSDFTADLRGLLRELKLEAKLADAQAWCADEEVDSLTMLARYVKDKAIADSLIARLQIKPGKAKGRTLLELIAERAPSQPAKAGPVQKMSHIKRQVSDQI